MPLVEIKVTSATFDRTNRNRCCFGLRSLASTGIEISSLSRPRIATAFPADSMLSDRASMWEKMRWHKRTVESICGVRYVKYYIYICSIRVAIVKWPYEICRLSLYEESIYEKWQERRTKIRERDLSSHVKLAFLGGGVTGVALAKTVKKSFGNEKEKVERWTGRRGRGGRRGERSTSRLREVLIYRNAGTLRLRLELTANLRVNSLGDKLAELRRKYSWHYAYA